MVSDYWGYVARKPRHAAEEGEAFEVCVERVPGSMPTVFSAHLTNLSREGLGFCANVPLEIDEWLTLKIQAKLSDFRLVLPATVRWRKKDSDDTWIFGCKAERLIDWESLGEMFLQDALVAELEVG